MQQEQSLGSVRALGAGVLLALTPSLVLALIDPITWRGAILFVTGVIILLVGAFTRWGMLFYAGTLVTAVMAIRYLGPWAQGIPRWVGIGIVGLLLLGLGVSWEFGRKNLRTASDYLRSLRLQSTGDNGVVSTSYEEIGGSATIRRMVANFYDVVATDP